MPLERLSSQKKIVSFFFKFFKKKDISLNKSKLYFLEEMILKLKKRFLFFNKIFFKKFIRTRNPFVDLLILFIFWPRYFKQTPEDKKFLFFLKLFSMFKKPCFFLLFNIIYKMFSNLNLKKKKARKVLMYIYFFM